MLNYLFIFDTTYLINSGQIYHNNNWAWSSNMQLILVGLMVDHLQTLKLMLLGMTD
jgi:hypothetical protein